MAVTDPPPSKPPQAKPKKEFKCPECSKLYTRKEFVERHRRLQHLDERPFECTQCQSAAFSRSDLLKRHLKTCNGKTTHNPDGSIKVRKKRRLAKTNATPTDAVHTDTVNVETNVAEDADGDTQFESFPAATTEDFLSSFDFLTANSFDSTTLLTSTSIPSTSTAAPVQPETTTNTTDLLEQILNNQIDQDRATLNTLLTQNIPNEDLKEFALSYHHEKELDPNLFNLSLVGMYTSRDKSNAQAEQQASIDYHDAISNFSTPSATIRTVAAWEKWVSGQDSTEVEDSSPDSPTLMKEPNIIVDRAYEGGSANLTSRFYIPPDKFLKAYAFHQWSIPSLPVLSRYARLAVSAFLPSMPIAHRASLRMAETDTHLAYAIAVAGALLAATPEGSLFGDQMLTEKRIYMVRDFSAPDSDFSVKFASLQALLVYQLVGFGHKEAHHVSMGQTFHGSVVMMMRQLGLPAVIREKENDHLPPLYTFAQTNIEKRWRSWINIETWRRAVFLVWLSDLECAVRFEQAPLLPIAEINLTLPAHDDLWDAISPPEWAACGLTYKHPPTFSDALDLLLQDGFPSDHAKSPLYPMGSFSYILLSRTLGYMLRCFEDSVTAKGPSRWFDLLSFVNADEAHSQTLKRVQRSLVRLAKFKTSNYDRVVEADDDLVESIVGNAASSQSLLL